MSAMGIFNNQKLWAEPSREVLVWMQNWTRPNGHRGEDETAVACGAANQ